MVLRSKFQNRAMWLGFGLDPDCRRGWGVPCGNGAPFHGNLTSRGLGVS